jgi:hypothetical protein
MIIFGNISGRHCCLRGGATTNNTSTPNNPTTSNPVANDPNPANPPLGNINDTPPPDTVITAPTTPNQMNSRGGVFQVYWDD